MRHDCHGAAAPIAFWATLFASAAAGPPLALAAEGTAARPNIVLIVADDLGYSELGCYGGHGIPTPHIDSLAAAGVRCTSGYVSCPVCSPTRAGLMTGRYQQRFGHEFNPGPPQEASDSFGLAKDETTIAERLHAAGYATGMVGKWHLGFREGFQPIDRGFAEFYGFLGGAHPYLPQRGGRENRIQRGRETVQEPEYLTDAFAREAVAFIDRHKSQPFFLYLPFNAVHNPLQATANYTARFGNVADEKRRTFSAMLSALDDAVGAVLSKLREAGLEDNTIVVFISDNGGPTPQTSSRNDPLHGTKGSAWEGGIRVPYMVQWKGRLPAGRVYDQPVIALDIHPTLAAATGITERPSKPLDGVNLLPYMQGEQGGAPHAALFWRYGPKMAVRMGDWKLVKPERPERSSDDDLAVVAGAQLYNLAADIGETKDLAAEHPDKARELAAAWETWNAQMVAPKWLRGDQRGTAARRRAARAAP